MLDQACARFLEYLAVIKNASPHTIRNYRQDLKSFYAFMEEEKAISHKSIREFLAHLKEKGCQNKTLARHLSSIKSLCKYLHQEKILDENPALLLESPKIKQSIPPVLTYQQVEQLLATPDAGSLLGFRDRTIFELFYSSALRLSELVALNRKDVDVAKRLIKVKGKGKKERLIPITKTAATWIESYVNHPERFLKTKEHEAQKDDEAIFLNKHGMRLSARSIDRNVSCYLKASGLAGKITPHTLRHAVATHWLENGMDLKSIQQLLGHQCLSTTTIYTKVSKGLKQKVYRECHPRAKTSL